MHDTVVYRLLLHNISIGIHKDTGVLSDVQ